MHVENGHEKLKLSNFADLQQCDSEGSISQDNLSMHNIKEVHNELASRGESSQKK
jgi:hypothetical protein